MKLKYLMPSMGLLFSSFCLNSSKVTTQAINTAKKPTTEMISRLNKDFHFREIVCDTFSRKISDERKIIDYNKLLKKYGQKNSNYIIIDKKNCQAKVYSPDGNVLYQTEVALGRHIGDKRGGGYNVKGAQLRAYTTPGEFLICREGSRGAKEEKLYSNRVLAMAGDHTLRDYQRTQILALHQIPSTPMGKLRENVFNNSTLKDNRCSFGCVNFLSNSYDKMRKLISGRNTKVYILPEEVGNSLKLEKQKNGSYKFVQTKYPTEAMEHNKPEIKTIIKKDFIKAKTESPASQISGEGLPVSSDVLDSSLTKIHEIKVNTIIKGDTLVSQIQ